MKKRTDSPDEDKSLADAKALITTLKDFFKKHPLINPKIFLGDAAFDSIEIYKYLLTETSFEKPLTTSKTVFVLQVVRHRMKKLFMPIYFLPELQDCSLS